MMQLHQDYEKFVERDTEIIAVGPDDNTAFSKFWEEHDLKFVGIADENQRILKLYDQKTNILKLGRLPAQMLINKEGIIKYVHYGNSMKDIPENSQILELIDNL